MKNISINIGNFNGDLILPDSEHLNGVILFIPCFTCKNTLDGLLNVSEMLLKRGYASMQISINKSYESIENFSNSTIYDHVDEVVEFADYIKKNVSKEIIVVGHWIGGIIAILAKKKIDVKGIITLSTPFDENAFNLNINRTIDDKKVELTINGKILKIRNDYLKDINEDFLVSTLEADDTPVLSVFFEEDEMISYDDSLNVLKKAKKNVETIILNRVTHFMDTDIESYYISNLIDVWSQNKLNKL